MSCGTFESYASIRPNVGQSLLAVGSCLRTTIDREDSEVQRGAHAALRHAAGGVQDLLVDLAEANDRSLSLIIGGLKRDVSDRLGSSSAHSAKCERRQKSTLSASDRGDATTGDKHQSSAFAPLGATVRWSLSIIPVDLS